IHHAARAGRLLCAPWLRDTRRSTFSAPAFYILEPHQSPTVRVRWEKGIKMLSGPSHLKKKSALFISVTVIGAIFFLEVFASWALMLRMRLQRAENFTKSEPTYFSLLNVPYKAGQKLGLFDQSLDGQRVFTERCAGCHGSDARGSANGP